MKKKINWRILLILFFVLSAGAGIIGRLFYLQVIQRKIFESQALGQQTSYNKVTGPRGEIFCKNSQETKGKHGSGDVKSLALNKDSWTLSVNPNDIEDKELFAEILSKSLDQSKENLMLKLGGEDTYVVLEKELSSAKADEIKDLNLKGIYFQNNPERFYPQGEMASQVLGFLGGAGAGQYGVEGYYEEILMGKSGIKEKRSGIDSIFFDGKEISLNGSDLYLTIDYNIQFQAEQLLKQEEKKNDIDSGQIIVMRPDTGRILALASYPNFNPNQYSKETDLEIFQNSSVQKLFEPGSIMKPFTMAAVLNEGKITSDTTYIDTGDINFGKYTIHNFANEIYGEQTMTQVLEKSINTGVVFAEQLIPHETFLDYMEKFGFFKKSGVDLQGEVYSNNDLLRKGRDLEFATASFGQGINLTPLQIARGFCAIANGGKLVKPYIVEKIVNGSDEVNTRPNISDPIISQQALSQLNAMLINVVDNGFNSVAKIPGYYIAGKTGTAQVPLKNGKGYEPDKTIQSFVGYGPALNPQFLILVKLDNPKVPKSSLSAVPVFRQLANYIINYWQIPPDYDSEIIK